MNLRAAQKTAEEAFSFSRLTDSVPCSQGIPNGELGASCMLQCADGTNLLTNVKTLEQGNTVKPIA
jgi:hypothetical protein